MTNFHLGTLQEAKKETNLRYTENTVTLKKKKMQSHTNSGESVRED